MKTTEITQQDSRTNDDPVVLDTETAAAQIERARKHFIPMRAIEWASRTNRCPVCGERRRLGVTCGSYPCIRRWIFGTD